MFRPTALLNAASKAAAFRSMPVANSRIAPVAYRFYSSAGLSQSDVEARVLDILRGFDKVDAKKVNLIKHVGRLYKLMHDKRRFLSKPTLLMTSVWIV